jgi:hypothetical protein
MLRFCCAIAPICGLCALVGVAQTPEVSKSWNDIVHEIVRQVPGFVPGPGFQVVPLPMRAQWDDPKLGSYYLWETMANRVPSWGEVYLPTVKRITDSYGLFLTSLALPPPGRFGAAGIARTRQQYLDDSRKLARFLEDRSNWDGALLKRGKASKAQKLRERVRKDASRYSALLGEAHAGFGGAGDLLIEFENPAYQREALSPDGLTLSYRTFNVSPDLSRWMTESSQRPSTRLANIVVPRPMSPRVPGQVKPIDATTTDPITGATVPDPRAELHFWVLGGATMALDQDVSSLEVKGKRVALFSVTPGRWFNGAALEFFRNGPWLDGPVKDGRVTFWGEQGLLNLMPTGLVVMYEPTVVLKPRNQGPAALAASLQSLLKTSKQLRFGSFTFLDNLTRVAAEPAEQQVTVTDLSGRAYVIAVVNAVLPADAALRASIPGLSGRVWAFASQRETATCRGCPLPQ